MTKEIPITKGYVALVDDEDYDRVIAVGSWQASEQSDTVYAVHNGIAYALMHRVIMGLKKGDKREVDHNNHNGLDNCKYNLFIKSHSENMRNRWGANANSTSGVLGVSWNERVNKWHAYIKVNGKRKHLGFHDTLEEATAARLTAAKQYGFSR